MTAASALIGAAIALALPASAGSDVVLRAGAVAPAGPVSAVTPDGVVVGSPNERGVVIGWDRVRAVPGVPDAAQHLPVAERAWRARERLERGDAPLAEPIFEELFSFYQWRSGPTARVVAEGLLRCRLRRGAHLASIDPWLALRLASDESAGPVHYAPDWPQRAGLGSVIDPVTGLAPGLPPMWVASPVVQAFAARAAAEIPSDAPAAGASVRALAALYRHAARFEAGWNDPWPEAQGSGTAVQFVTEIIRARAGDAVERTEARARLADRLTTGAAPWLVAWTHTALGRSLAREPSRDERLRAVVELLHVPAIHADAQPYLAGLCLAEAAVVLDELGDAAGASRLAHELIQNYPGHAVLDWEPFRTRWGRTAPAPAPAAISQEPTT